MDLYLVRHAIAFDHDPTVWPNDRERPLTEKGQERFRKAARGLKRLEMRPELVLSSSYVRARQTAEILQKDADWPAMKALAALEVGHTSAEVLDALRAYAGATSIALVSHEPNLHELAATLLVGESGRGQMEFRKGGIACLSVRGEDLRPGTAVLRWLMQPGVLRAIG
jgi:phosphohistidine phosphatase